VVSGSKGSVIWNEVLAVVGKPNHQSVTETMQRALDVSEEALGQVARIAIEEIHSGVESSNHVRAAERDIRSALRQLVLAERELRSGPGMRAGLDDRREGIAAVVPGSGSGPIGGAYLAPHPP
jgi:hypothetical protein